MKMKLPTKRCLIAVSITLLSLHFVASALSAEESASRDQTNNVDKSGPLIVAHRGASYAAPENTLAAFHLAWAENADGIEGDYYLTSDNEIVCLHDKSTKRTTGVDLKVTKATLEQLRDLDAGSWKGPQWKAEKLPTFAEVMATVPAGRTMVIELKSGVEIVDPLMNELKRLDRDDIGYLIISFDELAIAKCKERMPDIEAHWLTGFKYQEKEKTWTPDAKTIAKVVAESGADGVGMQGNTKVIDADFIAELKNGGCKTFHVWTIDSPEDARIFKELGAFGITTNCPADIRRAIGL